MLRNLKHYNKKSFLQYRSISYFNKNHDFITSEFDLSQESIDNIKSLTFGFTTYGVEQLGDIVYAESFKEINDVLSSDESVGVVESVKASVDIIPSIDGIITDINLEFFELIENTGGLGLDDITDLNSYDETDGIFLYKIQLNNDIKEETIQRITSSYMLGNEYSDYLERM